MCFIKKYMKVVVNKCVLDLSSTQVMGILNVTPDSFFDGGVYDTIPKAIDHVAAMIADGATLIDIGGESTRPGSKKISESEESDRVLPVLYEIMKRFNVFMSINTSSSLIMQESAKMGAHLINDTRSFSTIESLKAVVQSDLMLCLTHGFYNNFAQQFCNNFDIVREVSNYFNKQIIRFELAGIDRNRLLIDPGFGFGKSVGHNYKLLSNLKYFHCFCLPVLIGISRKSMINYNEHISPHKKLIGSITCAVIAAMQGIQIVRVHDVKETIEALKIIKIMHEFNRNMENLP